MTARFMATPVLTSPFLKTEMEWKKIISTLSSVHACGCNSALMPNNIQGELAFEGVIQPLV
jgi:hypothetical protein